MSLVIDEGFLAWLEEAANFLGYDAEGLFDAFPRLCEDLYNGRYSPIEAADFIRANS